MKLTRITIEGVYGHFKIPCQGRIQRTYEIPPISTVIGILQNIYNKDIENFTFGYTINFEGKHRDLMTVYKEVSLIDRKLTDADRLKKEVSEVEYLTNVTLTIYSDIKDDIELKDVLTIGKANCLGTITEIKEVDLIDYEGYGYNQYTSKNLGGGHIRRVNTLTKYNEIKDRYDFYSGEYMEQIEFKYDKNYDTDLKQNIFLFNYIKEGDVLCN